jgi:hypothetical protein
MLPGDLIDQRPADRHEDHWYKKISDVDENHVFFFVEEKKFSIHDKTLILLDFAPAHYWQTSRGQCVNP